MCRWMETLNFKHFTFKGRYYVDQLILWIKFCAEACCRLCFTMFSIYLYPKLLISVSCCPPMFLTQFYHFFFFLCTISCQDFHFMWHTICGSASLHVEPICCVLMSFAGGRSCCVLHCSQKEQSRYCSLAEMTVACIVTKGTVVLGSMFTFDVFLLSGVFCPPPVGSAPTANFKRNMMYVIF